MGCGGRSRLQEGLGGRSAEGVDPNRRTVRHHVIGRLDSADKASIRHGNHPLHRDDWVIEVELMLGVERGLQRRGGVVTGVIERGACVGARVVVIGIFIHGMAVSDRLARH